MTPDLITSEMVEKARIAAWGVVGSDTDSMIQAQTARTRAALEAALPEIVEACAKECDTKAADLKKYKIVVGKPSQFDAAQWLESAAASIRSLSPPTTKEREDG